MCRAVGWCVLARCYTFLGMLSLDEFVRWTGMTVFELWLHMTGVFIFTVLLTLKVHGWLWMSYWLVFSPLFIASALDSYYLFILCVRTYITDRLGRIPPVTSCLSFVRFFLVLGFELLLCNKIDGDLEPGQVAVRSSYGVVFVPVWILMGSLVFQGCRLY